MLPIVCPLLIRVITNRHSVVYFSSLFISGSVLQHLLLSVMLVFKLPKIERCYEHWGNVSLFGIKKKKKKLHNFLRVIVKTIPQNISDIKNISYTLLKASSCLYSRQWIFSPIQDVTLQIKLHTTQKVKKKTHLLMSLCINLFMKSPPIYNVL